MDANENIVILIFVNGKASSVPAGLTVSGLLEHLGVDPAKVAVEMDRRIVRKGEWATSPVGDGAEFEIVQFVGGGSKPFKWRVFN
jgi:thiamine biosynthesis protein ThiS